MLRTPAPLIGALGVTKTKGRRNLGAFVDMRESKYLSPVQFKNVASKASVPKKFVAAIVFRRITSTAEPLDA